MSKTNYTLQDWYLDKAYSKYASGQCESCYLNFKPTQIFWSEITQNFSCKSCIKEAKVLANKKLKELMNQKQLIS